MDDSDSKRIKLNDTNTEACNNNVNVEFIIEILIVDDSPTILKVITEMLRVKGYYSVNVASSSTEAIQILKQKVYDVALVDVNIPQLSGLELSSRFRDFESKADATARQKIIGMTSDFGETKMQDVINAGMDSFIFKPFNIQKFEELAIIKNLIEEKKNDALKVLAERERQLNFSRVSTSTMSNDQIQDDINALLIRSPNGSITLSHHTKTVPIGSTRSSNQTSVVPIIPPLSILVVDDSPTILKIITKMLEKAGHRVETQSTGLGALELLKTKNYDCVLMDINMPQWGGLEVSFEYRIHEYEQKQYFEYIAEQLHNKNNKSQQITSAATIGVENQNQESVTNNSESSTSAQFRNINDGTNETSATTNNSSSNNNIVATNTIENSNITSTNNTNNNSSSNTSSSNINNIPTSDIPNQAAHVTRIHQKIIAMTGEVNPKLHTEVMFGGFNGMLHKPFTLEKFNKIVAPLINNK